MRFIAKKWALLFGSALFLAPAFAYAQQLTGVTNLINAFITIVNIAIPLVVALAFLAFFYGLFLALLSGGEKAKEKGKPLMIWGIVILFVMLAIYGIIQFIAGNLGVATGGAIVPPSVQTQSLSQ